MIRRGRSESETDLMHATFYMVMAEALARVVDGVYIHWRILGMAMKIESEELIPQLETLAIDFQSLHSELQHVSHIYDMWIRWGDILIEKVENLKADSLPLWSDDYNLCGDPECGGNCRVCQEGEYDGEEEYTEKYHHRGRR